MSTTTANSIPIGPVQVYLENKRIGSPMSQATIRHAKESVQAGLPDAGVNVISRKTKETFEIDVVIADLIPKQLTYIYDKANSRATAGTLDSKMYTATASTVMRFRELHRLSGTTAITVDRSTYDTGTVQAFKSDFSNAPDGYTKGTDFTGTAAVGTIARLAGGSITTGDEVVIEYSEAVDAKVVNAGGSLVDFEGVLLLVHELNNGKFLQFKFHRVRKIGASDIAINMAAEFGGIPMTFHALADMAKNTGKQVMEISQEI